MANLDLHSGFPNNSAGFCDAQVPFTLHPLCKTMGPMSTKIDFMKYF